MKRGYIIFEMGDDGYHGSSHVSGIILSKKVAKKKAARMELQQPNKCFDSACNFKYRYLVDTFKVEGKKKRKKIKPI